MRKWKWEHILLLYLFAGFLYAFYNYSKNPQALTFQTVASSVLLWPIHILGISIGPLG